MPSVQLQTASTSIGLEESAAAGPANASALPPLLHTPGGLAIVEIQGTIRGYNADDESGESPRQTSIGRLEFPLYNDDGWMKKVYLYVGKHQRMTGVVQKLAKPLAVIQSSQAQQDDDSTSQDLEIVDIVKYKLLFSGRPEPVSE